MFREVQLLKCLILSCLLVFLSACSGGDGSQSEDDFVLTYTGKSDQAVLNRINSLDLLETTYDLILPAFYLSSIGTYANTPYFLEFNEETLLSDKNLDSESICDSGSTSLEDRRAKNESTGTVVFHFSSCVSDGETLHGKIFYYLTRVNELNLDINISIDNLSISNGSETIILDGNTRYSETDGSFNLSGMLTAKSKELEQYYYVTNLEITNLSMSARIYHDQYGYVDVVLNGESNSLLMEGASQTSLAGTANKISNGYPHYLDSFDLEINDGIERDYPLVTNIDINTLLERSDTINSQLLRIESESTVYSIDRLATLNIPSAIVDVDNDFIEYTWKNLFSPLGCEASVERNTSSSANFTPNCQGAHSITLAANDGIHSELEYELSINVIPLPANLAEISDLQTVSGEEINIPVIVSNLTEDGPFTFSLVSSPKGINIDDEGVITGIPVAFIKEDVSNFNVNVLVDNGRGSNISFAMDISGGNEKKKLITNTSICRNPNTHWADIDGDGLVETACQFLHTYRLVELNGIELQTSYIELDPPSNEELYSVIHYDTNGDDVAEIILGYASEIFVIDGVTKKTIKQFPVPFIPHENYSTDYEILLPPSGFNGFFIYVNKYDYEYHLLDPDGIAIKPHIISEVSGLKGYKNIDSDPEPEIFIGGNRVYDFESGYELLVKTVDHVMDIDGDGEKDLISTTQSDYFDPIFWTIEILDNELNVKAQYTLNKPDVSVSSLYADLTFANVDDDPELEILVDVNGLLLFDFDGENYVYHSTIASTEESNIDLFDLYITHLTQNSVLLWGRFGTYSYNMTAGLTQIDLEVSSVRQSFTRPFGEFTKPFKQSDGSFSIYYQGNNYDRDIGVIDISSAGEFVSSEILNGIPAPSEMHSMIGTSYSSKDAKEILIDSYGADFEIFDRASRSLVYSSGFENTALRYTELLEADFDENGSPDYFTILRQSGHSNPMITWFAPSLDQELWSFVDDENYFSSNIIDPKVVSLDGGKKQYLTGLFSPRSFDNSDAEFKAYSFEAGTIQEAASIEINERYSYDHIVYGLQDVDGDNKLEIIVSIHQRYCDYNRTSEVMIIDDDFTQIRTIDVDECLAVIPNIISGGPKSNIIASTSVGELSLGQNLATSAHSKFIEIGAMNGDIIWESKWFMGQLDSDSLELIGSDSHLSKKIGVFDAGIYIFE
jgi:hypothetical protein